MCHSFFFVIFINSEIFVWGEMSLLDYLRQEYVKGRVLDKYVLSSGNVGLVIEDDSSQRYHVEFEDGKGPGLDNLFGLLNEPFSGKTEQMDRLISEGDSVELTVSYSKGPLREAYCIHAVSGPASCKTPPKLLSLPYRFAQTRWY